MMKDELKKSTVTSVYDEDAPLVTASQAGDSAAFDQLVSRHHRKLFRIAYHIVHNADDAQDAVQESLIKVFQNIGQFQSQSKFSTWLYRIVVNQCLMKMRTQRTKPLLVDLFLDGNEEEGRLPIDVSDWRPNPEQQYTQSELRDILTRLLQEVPPALRVVFIMHDIEGQQLQEVADALDLTLSAVKTRSLRARLYLRERLTLYFKKHLEEKRVACEKSAIARAIVAFA
jgi:RNA polymerase sigma-70 factor, ECF subfamily